MRFVLASQSPRRHELLTLFGIPFTIHVADIDETQHTHEAPADYVRRLSQHKAHTVSTRLNVENVTILAADTIVVDGDEVLGKPQNAAEAEHTLRRLRGRTHHVMTAVTLLRTSPLFMQTERAISPVTMRSYTDAEIEAYIATGDPFDKAGAYAIQNEGFAPAQQFSHCFANVMGLPLCHVARLLEAAGIQTPKALPERCQTHLSYTCEVYSDFHPAY